MKVDLPKGYGQMQCNYLDDDFAHTLLGIASESTNVGPSSFYNEDGDCIEIHFDNESFYAERADGVVTLYIGTESGKVVGAVIKGIRELVRTVLAKSPGFRVEITEVSGVKLERLLSVALWTKVPGEDDDCIVQKYKFLRDEAEKTDMRINLQELESVF